MRPAVVFALSKAPECRSSTKTAPPRLSLTNGIGTWRSLVPPAKAPSSRICIGHITPRPSTLANDSPPP